MATGLHSPVGLALLVLASVHSPDPVGPGRVESLAAPARPSRSAAYLTIDEALGLAFPDCRIERRTVFLTGEQEERAKELAGSGVESSIVFPYVATKEGELVGTAWFDTHRVRSLRETLMFVVAPDRRIRRIEMLAFAEPEEYIPRPSWYAQFLGKRLDDGLRLKRGIKTVTGATLTAVATTDAARRVLALHEVVFPPPPPEPEPRPEPVEGRVRPEASRASAAGG